MREREREGGGTARYNYLTLRILFSFLENAALKFCSQD